jgi:hypothetical protein
VVISGRNGRRVIHEALNAARGDCVALIRERRRQDDGQPSAKRWGKGIQRRPNCWSGTMPRRSIPARVVAAAAAVHSTIAWRPLRSPELMPGEALWCLAKAQVAATRPSREDQPADDLVHGLAEQAVQRIAAFSPLDRLRCSGLLGSKFQWLST